MNKYTEFNDSQKIRANSFNVNDIIGLMADAERIFIGKGQGYLKKQYVLGELRDDFESVSFARYLPILDPLIDSLKSIAKGNNTIFNVLLRKQKKNLFSCIG
jgi:hypothetical protein